MERKKEKKREELFIKVKEKRDYFISRNRKVFSGIHNK
jgi:hypothetical protein